MWLCGSATALIVQCEETYILLFHKVILSSILHLRNFWHSTLLALILPSICFAKCVGLHHITFLAQIPMVFQLHWIVLIQGQLLMLRKGHSMAKIGIQVTCSQKFPLSPNWAEFYKPWERSQEQKRSLPAPSNIELLESVNLPSFFTLASTHHMMDLPLWSWKNDHSSHKGSALQVLDLFTMWLQ